MSPREFPHPDPGRRSSRLAAALGVAVGCALIWGSLAALNHSVLGFHAWPTPDRPQAARLVVPDPSHADRAGGSAAVRLAVRGGNVVPAGTLVPGAGGTAVTVGTTQGPGGTNDNGSGTRPGAQVGPPGGVLGPDGKRRRGTTPAPSAPTTGTPVVVPPALVDTDGDGLPDVYETAHGMNPSDPADGATDSNGDGVTKAEEYRRLVNTQSGSKGKGTVPVDTPIDVPVVTPPVEPAPAPDPTPAPDPQATPTPAAPPEPVTPVDPPPAEPAPPTDPPAVDPPVVDPPVADPPVATPPVTDPQDCGTDAPADPVAAQDTAPVAPADTTATPAPAA